MLNMFVNNLTNVDTAFLRPSVKLDKSIAQGMSYAINLSIDGVSNGEENVLIDFGSVKKVVKALLECNQPKGYSVVAQFMLEKSFANVMQTISWFTPQKYVDKSLKGSLEQVRFMFPTPRVYGVFLAPNNSDSVLGSDVKYYEIKAYRNINNLSDTDTILYAVDNLVKPLLEAMLELEEGGDTKSLSILNDIVAQSITGTTNVTELIAKTVAESPIIDTENQVCISGIDYDKLVADIEELFTWVREVTGKMYIIENQSKVVVHKAKPVENTETQLAFINKYALDHHTIFICNSGADYFDDFGVSLEVSEVFDSPVNAEYLGKRVLETGSFFDDYSSILEYIYREHKGSINLQVKDTSSDFYRTNNSVLRRTMASDSKFGFNYKGELALSALGNANFGFNSDEKLVVSELGSAVKNSTHISNRPITCYSRLIDNPEYTPVTFKDNIYAVIQHTLKNIADFLVDNFDNVNSCVMSFTPCSTSLTTDKFINGIDLENIISLLGNPVNKDDVTISKSGSMLVNYTHGLPFSTSYGCKNIIHGHSAESNIFFLTYKYREPDTITPRKYNAYVAKSKVKGNILSGSSNLINLNNIHSRLDVLFKDPKFSISLDDDVKNIAKVYDISDITTKAFAELLDFIGNPREDNLDILLRTTSSIKDIVIAIYKRKMYEINTAYIANNNVPSFINNKVIYLDKEPTIENMSKFISDSIGREIENYPGLTRLMSALCIYGFVSISEGIDKGGISLIEVL